MSAPACPPLIRHRLGRMLRNLRCQTRISFADACRRLEFSPARLSRLENGRTAPELHALKSMLDLYQVPVNDWQPYLAMAREARRKGWWQYQGVAAQSYVGMETGASSLCEFKLSIVPGLLQTADYARALFTTQSPTRSRDWIDSAIDVRMQRQQRLTDSADPITYTAILDEGVLRREVGGAAVMLRQLSQLVARASLPNATLRVVPSVAAAHIGTNGSFSLLSFPDEEYPTVVHIESVVGSTWLDKPDQVRAATSAFDQIKEVALSPDESLRMIECIADSLRKERQPCPMWTR